MKMVTHNSQKLSNGHSLNTSTYHRIAPKKVIKMINRIWERSGGQTLLRSPTGMAIPAIGMEILRISHTKMVVCQVTGGFNPNPSIDLCIKSGYTHFYNENVDEWISLAEVKEELKTK